MEKLQARNSVWRSMEENRVARFPGARGRIPNFIGAEKCCQLLNQLDVWKNARIIKANPDSPQRPLRQMAFEQGKLVYMAVPRLREEACFIELDPSAIRNKYHEASTIKGAFKHGNPVTLPQMKKIDLIICGSVAVNHHGERVGKGGGYSDLEYALAREAGKVTSGTPIITSVHKLQIISDRLKLEPHDIPVDFIITPEGIIKCQSQHPKPAGVYWEFLNEEKIDAIPVLRKIRSR